MAISTTAPISTSVKFIRDLLNTELTDPLTRAGNEAFVMSSYPGRDVRYPIITIKSEGTSQVARLGMRAESDFLLLNFEIRVWAKNERQKDELAEQVYTALRQNQTNTSTGTIDNCLFGFILNGIVDVDETGLPGIKSKVMSVSYNVFGLG